MVRRYSYYDQFIPQVTRIIGFPGLVSRFRVVSVREWDIPSLLFRLKETRKITKYSLTGFHGMSGAVKNMTQWVEGVESYDVSCICAKRQEVEAILKTWIKLRR